MDKKALSVNFDIQIVHSVEEVGQEAWDQLGRERPFASYRWYRFGETVLIKDTPIYVILSLGGEPVARATFWLTSQEPVDTGPRIIVGYVLPLILRRWPLLLCRSPLFGSSGLILPDDPQLHKAALETITQVAQDLARKYRVSFLVFDCLKQQEVEQLTWPAPFIPVTMPGPGTHLIITWPDFESYLSHLSRKKRKHYRQHLKRAAEMGVEITQHPTVTPVDKAITLIRNVEKRYHEPPAYWTRRLLENAATVDAVWLAAEIEGRLVGCELMLGDRGSWQVMALGRDYDYEYVYFLLGYTDIRYAIENGAKALHWGRCAYDVKRRLGFELEGNNHVVFAGRGALLQRLGCWMAAMVQNGGGESNESRDISSGY
jgi:predicted N-acyltransferase